MKTSDSHGPSGLDAQEWRRLLTSFKGSSSDLCKTISKLAYRIATEELDFLTSYNSCRLIALDKCPGVRPIGIGEVLRRVIGKSITTCLKADLKLLGGNTQLCLGQRCGIEYAIHSLRSAFETSSCDAMLLIDAQNAFNSLNRDLALKNIDMICPALSNSLKNSYKTPSNLFINKKCIKSQEGTTQGDPLAMAMYGIALLPLIEMTKNINVLQKWFADDGNAAGSLESLKELYNCLCEHGPAFGYKVIKCHLIIKPNKRENAEKMFASNDVDIIEGHRVLGSVIGSENECQKFMNEKKDEYTKLLNKLSEHGKTSPQSVYKSFTNGVQHKLTFISRTTPNCESLFEETEKIIKDELIPSLVNHNSYNDNFRNISSYITIV